MLAKLPFTAKLRIKASGTNSGPLLPRYDRLAHEPVCDVQLPACSILLLEGATPLTLGLFVVGVGEPFALKAKAVVDMEVGLQVQQPLCRQRLLRLCGIRVEKQTATPPLRQSSCL